jgi:putative hydrolase of the HAD superfamily
MEYRNYIFDFYGTLCDIHTDEGKPSLWKKTAEIYSAFGAGYSGTELKKAYSAAIAYDCKRNAKDENYEPDIGRIFSGLFREKGVKVSKDTVKTVAVTFRALSRSYIRLYPGVEELLGSLKKRDKKIYLLSNAQADFTRPEITMLGIDRFFDGIFISSEQGVKKPGRLFFERLLEAYSLDPKESIMIGNDEEADIAGAQDVGMDSLYIHSNISPSVYGKLKPTYSVTDGDFTKIRDLILS